MHTAFVKVPEEDIVSEGFGQTTTTAFDIEAQDFGVLCQKMGV